MEVILLERIERLGQMGDVVRVKAGFARNFLLPRKKALRATKDNMTVFEGRRAELEAANLARKSEAEQVAVKIDGRVLVLLRQAGESGQLYGSVAARDIAEAAGADGVHIDKSQVVLDRPIKNLGLHKIRVRLHPEVSVNVTANVARTPEEAEIQAKTGQMVTLDSQRAAEDKAIEEALATAAAVEAPAEEASDAAEAPAKKKKAKKDDAEA